MQFAEEIYIYEYPASRRNFSTNLFPQLLYEAAQGKLILSQYIAIFTEDKM
jgi:hypothetical protein